MSDLNQVVASSLTARYVKLAGMVRELASPLTDEQFWTKPFPFGNSVGHLLLHLTGNLNYYIGAQIAETGYVRDRPREFSETSRPLKGEVLKKFDDAVEMAIRTIAAQSAEDWKKEYSATGADAKNRFDMVLQCATHLHHHIGQMMYLKFEFARTMQGQPPRLSGK
jgi:DinB superfamily